MQMLTTRKTRCFSKVGCVVLAFKIAVQLDKRTLQAAICLHHQCRFSSAMLSEKWKKAGQTWWTKVFGIVHSFWWRKTKAFPRQKYVFKIFLPNEAGSHRVYSSMQRSFMGTVRSRLFGLFSLHHPNMLIPLGL